MQRTDPVGPTWYGSSNFEVRLEQPIRGRQAGAPLERLLDAVLRIQRMLGHASAAMTLDVYAGLFSDDLDAVADRLDAAYTRTRTDSDADFLRTRDPTTPLRPPTRDRERGRDLR